MSPDSGGNKLFSVKNVLILIFVIGIIARITSLALLPDAAYNDSLYHLTIVKEAIQNQSFSLENYAVPPPLYYLINSSISIFTGLDFTHLAIKLIPTFLMVVELLLAFILMRKLFPNNYLPGLAFYTVIPWLIRFGSVNHIDTLAAITVMASFYFYLKIKESKSTILFYTIPAAFVLAALALAKINTTILVPIFFFGFLLAMNKKNYSSKALISFALIVVILAGFWFGLNFINFGRLDQHIRVGDSIGKVAIGLGENDLGHNLYRSSFYFFYFWDFPNPSSFGAIPVVRDLPIWIPMLLFAIIVLPMTFLLIKAVKDRWEENGKKLKQIDWLIGLTILACFSIVVIGYGAFSAYYRWFIPVMPFSAVVFAYGFSRIKTINLKSFVIDTKKIKLLVIGSLFLFSLYSLAYTAGSAYMFNQVSEKHAPLYNFISTLPEDSQIIIQPNNVREVEFFAGKSAGDYNATFASKSTVEVHKALKDYGYTHIAIICHKEKWDPHVLEVMEEIFLVEKVYSDSCGAVYEILE